MNSKETVIFCPRCASLDDAWSRIRIASKVVYVTASDVEFVYKRRFLCLSSALDSERMAANFELKQLEIRLWRCHNLPYKFRKEFNFDSKRDANVYFTAYLSHLRHTLGRHDVFASLSKDGLQMVLWSNKHSSIEIWNHFLKCRSLAPEDVREQLYDISFRHGLPRMPSR